MVKEIRRLMQCLQVLNVFYTSREANTHVVTRFVAREYGRINWLGDMPSWLVHDHVIENDKPITKDPNREVSCGVINHNLSIPHLSPSFFG